MRRSMGILSIQEVEKEVERKPRKMIKTGQNNQMEGNMMKTKFSMINYIWMCLKNCWSFIVILLLCFASSWSSIFISWSFLYHDILISIHSIAIIFLVLFLLLFIITSFLTFWRTLVLILTLCLFILWFLNFANLHQKILHICNMFILNMNNLRIIKYQQSLQYFLGKPPINLT